MESGEGLSKREGATARNHDNGVESRWHSDFCLAACVAPQPACMKSNLKVLVELQPGNLTFNVFTSRYNFWSPTFRK